tara:strand:+ start:8576 stop:9379 length:804 start_codon:yes stop_codon:yes gene_type:complete
VTPLNDTTPEITVLTLFAGRWHCLEAFLDGLDNLDYPKKKLHLVWFTNSDDNIFLECLEREGEKRFKDYASLQLIKAPIRPTSWAFKDQGTGYLEHANTIATLYNTAYQYVETDLLFFLEDDVLTPTHALRRFLKAYAENPLCAYISGIVFDRHNPGVYFVWDIDMAQTPRPDIKQYQHDYVLRPPRKCWGLQKIGAAGFSCTLVRTSILNRLKRPNLPIFHEKSPLSSTTGGSDICMGMELNFSGYEVYADYDVRAFHMDAESKLH